MILYRENPKDSTKKETVRINKSSKVAGYKIYMQKSIAFLYTNQDLSKRGHQENNPSYNGIKKNKIPRNKFNQGGEDLYTENYKTLVKEIEEDTNKWKDIEELILLKCACYPKRYTDSTQSLSKF